MSDDEYIRDLDEWISYWGYMCLKAANKAGISVEELNRRLDNDEGFLELTFVASREKK